MWAKSFGIRKMPTTSQRMVIVELTKLSVSNEAVFVGLFVFTFLDDHLYKA